MQATTAGTGAYAKHEFDEVYQFAEGRLEPVTSLEDLITNGRNIYAIKLSDEILDTLGDPEYINQDPEGDRNGNEVVIEAGVSLKGMTAKDNATVTLKVLDLLQLQ